MSADNDFLGGLHSPELDTLVTSVVDTLTLENADFACNLLAFHMNVCINKYGADRVLAQEYISVVDTCLQKVLQLENGTTPEEYFMHHFAS
jgi:hypothetical protein